MNLISQNYPSFVEALPANIREPVLEAISSLQLKVAEHIEDVLQNEETLRNDSAVLSNAALTKFFAPRFRSR